MAVGPYLHVGLATDVVTPYYLADPPTSSPAGYGAVVLASTFASTAPQIITTVTRSVMASNMGYVGAAMALFGSFMVRPSFCVPKTQQHVLLYPLDRSPCHDVHVVDSV